jgi:hypothetical protein
MPAVQRQRISGHSPYEPVFGFSRAVVAGDRVLVAGTAPVPPGGGPPPAEPYAQARLPGRLRTVNVETEAGELEDGGCD